MPGGCTGELQPLDLAVIGPFKEEMGKCFTNWFASKVANCLDSGGDVEHVAVDLRISGAKASTCQLVNLYYSISG